MRKIEKKRKKGMRKKRIIAIMGKKTRQNIAK
jgi:hypothetical protein